MTLLQHSSLTISMGLRVQVERHTAVGLGGHHQPVELVFVPAYGTITSHLWFGLGNLLVGFSSGQVGWASSPPKKLTTVGQTNSVAGCTAQALCWKMLRELVC